MIFFIFYNKNSYNTVAAYNWKYETLREAEWIAFYHLWAIYNGLF